MDDRELQTNNSNVPDAGTPAPAVPNTPDVNTLPVVSPDRQQQQTQIVSNPSVQPAQPQADPNASHPAVRNAGVLHSIAETLAGGPRFKPVIDSDGKRTLQRVPMDRRDIGMAIALSAITGALSGLQAKGPNAEAQAAGRGFATVSQMRSEADQAAEQRATQDFARRAGVFEANNRALLNAMQIGRLQKENHDAYVQASADRLSDLKENSPDAVKAEHLRESEASDVQKHSAVDLERIPDGTIPRLDANGRPVFVNQFGQVVPEGTRGAYQAWDNTYALVDKNARTPLRDDNDEPVQWLKNAVDWGLLPAANLKGRGDLPSYVAGRTTHQVSAANMLQSELKTFADYLNEGKKPTDQGYVQPIDLKAKLKSSDVTWNDITNLQRAIAGYHGTGQINSPDTQLAAMRASADPKIRDSASAISALFGPTNLDNFTQKREFEQKQRDALAKETPSERGERQATAAQKRAEVAKITHDIAQGSTNSKSADGNWNMNSVPVALVEGTMDPTQLTKRSKDYNATIEQANAYSREKYGKPFDVAQAQSDYRFATNVQTQNTLRYLNSLTGSDNKSGNLGKLVNLSNQITRTSFPSLNDAAAWARLEVGDPQIAAYRAAVTEVADQVAKIMQGGGTGGGTSDAKLKQAQELFDTGFNKDQITGVSQTLRSLLANRKTELIGDNRYLRKQFGQAAQQQTAQQPNTAPEGTVITVQGQQLVKRNGQWVPQNR